MSFMNNLNLQNKVFKVKRLKLELHDGGEKSWKQRATTRKFWLCFKSFEIFSASEAKHNEIS